jgi:hypothetical protein
MTNGKHDKDKGRRDRLTDVDPSASSSRGESKDDSAGRMSMDFLLGGHDETSKGRGDVTASARREEVRSSHTHACANAYIYIYIYIVHNVHTNIENLR